ncbi:MAG TPA: asparagine synthase (glutamine-hydrolyzing) [Candidatus Omnitrophota bacterium]|nr:asparagine synthase (glutamine-hydrolyzing) [Candidatus Omnitrophota bacterium]HPD84144.1 asparagine synthase (glutamine-hydrolyzing) [Candidatus Omnitrophota bacterium]HRZ03001.1 asparagine synthase (glutamine-hydrolyzing) [Candidatus Omnitrophota bacterium]
MCGIAGILTKQQDCSSLIESMGASLNHRGPDGRGLFIDKEQGVYLSHNRLSIIDLSSNARQPIYSEDNNVLAVVNGEIYNFTDLREHLKQKGHQFRSTGDSEVVVHAYEQWGEDFVNRLDGMFAFCLWDKKENKLVLARDAIGIKPLYFLRTDKILVFASEIKAFLQLPKKLYTPTISRLAAQTLLTFSIIPQDNLTILEGIEKLPPGHMLIAGNGEVKFKEFWKLNSSGIEATISFSDACGQLEERLLKAVKAHLQSDVGLGVLLSGGVDSSLIAAMAAKVLKEPILTFTAGFDHPKDERSYAESVARSLGSRHISFTINPNEVFLKIEELMESFDDLSSVDGGFITTFLIAQRIKQSGIKVVLSGEGADEIFGGYPWFMLADFPFNILPQGLRNRLYYCRISKNLTRPGVSLGSALMNDFIGSLNQEDIFRQVSGFEIRRQLPNSFLMKVDKAAMAHGVEVRVPYLAKEIVEFVYNLPKDFKRRRRVMKFGRVEGKSILRCVAQKYISREIAFRRKQGFMLPVDRVLQSNGDKVRSYLLEPNSFARNMLEAKELEDLLSPRGCSVFPFSKQKEALLWRLFVLEIWHKKFLKMSENRQF